MISLTQNSLRPFLLQLSFRSSVSHGTVMLQWSTKATSKSLSVRLISSYITSSKPLNSTILLIRFVNTWVFMCKNEFRIIFLPPLICDRLQQPYIEKTLLFYIFRQVFVNKKVEMCGKMAKCDMGEMHSENTFLQVT